jgi:tRNA threonylcarbamoyladenosine biosynthesis protein TsaE
VTTHASQSEAETEAIGREVGASLVGGEVLLIAGPLGAGKTAFVRGLAEGIGANRDDVSSPTFALIQEYRGRLLLEHIDLYRLHPHEVADLGLDEMATGESVLAVEWPDRWLDAPVGATHIRIEPEGETTRRITIVGTRDYP